MTTPDPYPVIEPVELRPDASIKLVIGGGEVIVWGPPMNRHIEEFRDRHAAIADDTRTRLIQLQGTMGTDPDEIAPDAPDPTEQSMVDSRALAADVATRCAVWVRDVHTALAVTGDLPADVDDWPPWLARLQFLTAVSRHWGLTPFGLKNG